MPTYSMINASQWTPAIAKNGAPAIGATPIRPAQLIWISMPRLQRVAARDQHEQLARDHDRDRPPRKQREVPADDHPRDDQEPVDERIEQRAEAAVLAGQARGEAVEVVRPADHREQHDRERVLAVVARQRDHQEHRDRGEPDEVDRVRDRPRVQGVAGQRRLGRRPRPVDPAQAPLADVRAHRPAGRRLTAARARARRPPRRRRPAGPCATPGPAGSGPRPRRLQSVRRPTVTRSGQPSSSASVNFSPGPASRSS